MFLLGSANGFIITRWGGIYLMALTDSMACRLQANANIAEKTLYKIVRGIGFKGIEKMYIGQKLRIKKGYKPTQSAQWLETGDVVKVMGIYRHIILVGRPYRRNPKQILRESFRLLDVDKYLQEVYE